MAKKARKLSIEKNNLKEVRERFGISQAELARRAGLVPATLAAMEKGEPTRKISRTRVFNALEDSPEKTGVITYKGIFPKG